MIEIKIKTDGKKVIDTFTKDKPTLNEYSLVLFRLEQIKQEILKSEFVSNLEIEEDNSKFYYF